MFRSEMRLLIFWRPDLSPSESEALRAARREDNDPADNGGGESGK